MPIILPKTGQGNKELMMNNGEIGKFFCNLKKEVSGMKRFLLTAFCFLISCSISYAGTAASCSQSDVQAAINAASSGDTVTVPAGSCIWATAVSIPNGKKITLQGAGKTSTLITGSTLYLNQSGSRVTGFGFTDTEIVIDGDGWRIDNNSLTPSAGWPALCYILVRGTRSNAHPTGLIDNNYFTRIYIMVLGYPGNGKVDDSAYLWSLPTGLGTGDNVVYIENNTFTTGLSDHAQNDCMDSNYGGRFVFRYNTLINTGTEAHGVQGSANRSNPRWEYYNNSFTTAAAVYNTIWTRGGTGVIFGNTISGPYSATGPIFDNQTSERYGDYDCPLSSCSAWPGGYHAACDGNNPRDGNRTGQKGYPCRDQVGRGQDDTEWHAGDAYAQKLTPVYIWNNIKNGSEASAPAIASAVQVPPLTCAPSDTTRYLLHIVKDRDFYYSSGVQTSTTSPFNGTSGVGYGTLANRPTTCTHVPVSTGLTSGDQTYAGVAYWATDTNTLYKCTATNTWTAFYQPYTCPHPLAVGSGSCNPNIAGRAGYSSASGRKF
jgi:hypothetical protein